jgi:hypothetical protein
VRRCARPPKAAQVAIEADFGLNGIQMKHVLFTGREGHPDRAVSPSANMFFHTSIPDFG